MSTSYRDHCPPVFRAPVTPSQLPDDKCTPGQGLHHKAPVTIQASVLVLIQQKGVTISLSFD